MNSGTAEAVVVICHCNHNNTSTKMLESKHIGCVVYWEKVEAENSHRCSCTLSSQLARLIIAHTTLLYSILVWNSRLLMCCFHKYCSAVLGIVALIFCGPSSTDIGRQKLFSFR